jgi:outer membrane cobalamin receptor
MLGILDQAYDCRSDAEAPRCLDHGPSRHSFNPGAIHYKGRDIDQEDFMTRQPRHNMRGKRAYRRRSALAITALLACTFIMTPIHSALNADPTAPTAETNTAGPAEAVITIKAQEKQKARPQSKASQTVISGEQINQSAPGLTLNDIITRFTPGASSNPNNGMRIRGADDQFSTYLDGVPLPLSVTGTVTDAFDPKDIQTLRVYTGGFPAELGGQLSGVFDITTNTGSGKPTGTVSQSIAADSTYVTDGSITGGSGKVGYFGSASARQTDFFLSPPYEGAGNNSGHVDYGFVKLDYNDGSNDKTILQLGSNGANFEVPGTLDNQQEWGNMANIVWRHIDGLAVTRFSFYSHASGLRYTGSPLDFTLPYDGLYDTNENLHDTTLGVRGDQTWAGGKAHLFKIGFDVSKTTVAEAYLIDVPDGPPLTDDDAPHAWNTGLYAQDDWTTGRFLINYGARFDENSQDITTNQVSPRVNIKYRLENHNTLHGYYDKLFQPIPVQDAAHLVGNPIVQDAGTELPLQPERDDFFEAGIDHDTGGLSLGALAYYKSGKDTRDDDQVGASNVTLPVNDARAYFNGFEFTADKDFSHTLEGFANLGISWNKNAGPVTGGLNEGGFPTTYFFDDHDQTYTSTFGVSYNEQNIFANLTGEYGSGQPYGEIDDADGNAIDVNYIRVPPHLVFNADIGKTVSGGFGVTLFVNNMFNDAYLIKQVTALSSPQYAEGRVAGVKLSEDF